MSFLTRIALLPVALAVILVPQFASAQKSPPILIAGPANDSAAPIFYANDLGLYKKASLDVTAQAFENLGATVSAVVGGSTTFGSISLPAIALARDKGLPIVIVAPLSTYSKATPTTAIVVLKNSGVKSARDLNGKTIIAQNLSSLAYYATKAWIDKNGGNAASVKWLELHDNQAVPAMLAGQADAAAITEPALDDAVHGSSARMLASMYDIMGDKFLISALFTTEDYAKAHPEIVRKMASIIIYANRWANKNHLESAKILEKYAKVTIPATAARVTYAEALNSADAQPVLDMLNTYGVLKNRLRVSDLFSPEVLSVDSPAK